MSEYDHENEATAEAVVGWDDGLAAFMGYCIRMTGRGLASDPAFVRHNSKPNRERLAARSRIALEAVREFELIGAQTSMTVDREELERLVTLGLRWPSLDDWFRAKDEWVSAEAPPSQESEIKPQDLTEFDTAVMPRAAAD